VRELVGELDELLEQDLLGGARLLRVRARVGVRVRAWGSNPDLNPDPNPNPNPN
jgi:hypothetical protein